MVNFTNSFHLLLILFITVLFPGNGSSTVVIVGTGPAGIAAATRLLKNNITDLLILEAENRIGGRINSIEYGDGIVDMGAEWCDGQEGNIVYDLVKEYNMLGHTDVDFTALFYSDGELVDRNLSEKLFKILENIYTLYARNKQREGISLGEYCVNRYLTEINQLSLNTTKHRRIANDFLEYFQKYVISGEGSFTWFDPSAQCDYRDCSGDHQQNWGNRGFKTILDVLMQKFPNTSQALPIDDKIILKKEVDKIVWDNRDDGVVVKCSDGSWYHADHVIFTPSLGVLKERHTYMFEPQLPQKKQLAIEKLGIGAVLKIMVLFQKRWWPETYRGSNFVWSSEHKNIDHPRFTKGGHTWIFDAVALIPTRENSSVLSFWFVGKSVPIIEQLVSVELLEGINFILTTFLGKTYELTYPVSFVKSQWYTNRYFRGTYSYQTIASRKIQGNLNLGTPLYNRNGKLVLMFAGEATHPNFYGTVHGAIETGHREADRIIKEIAV